MEPVIYTLWHGGPTLPVRIRKMMTMQELRTALWPNARGAYEVDILAPSRLAIDYLVRHLRTARGRAFPYLLTDLGDWYVGGRAIAGGFDPTVLTVPAGFLDLQDSGSYQLVKAYTSDAGTFYRSILRPHANVGIYIDGVLQDPTTYTLSRSTGLVHFTSAPSLGAVLSWRGSYDVLARFDSDAFTMTMVEQDAAQITGVTIVEILDLG